MGVAVHEIFRVVVSSRLIPRPEQSVKPATSESSAPPRLDRLELALFFIMTQYRKPGKRRDARESHVSSLP